MNDSKLNWAIELAYEKVFHSTRFWMKERARRLWQLVVLTQPLWALVAGIAAVAALFIAYKALPPGAP